MDDAHLGATLRALRVHQGLRQEDVATAAGLSPATVSRLERGHLATVPLGAIRAIAGTLEARLDLTASWRGGDLDRLVNARHGALHDVLAHRFAGLSEWESAAEVSFSIYGERGVIDRLAYHAGRRMLCVIELKSELTDPGGLVGQVDRYRRLGPVIARDRGWKPRSVSCWVVLADTDTNRRRVAMHEALLRGAFPLDGRAVTRWLHDPEGAVQALSFVAYPQRRTAKESFGAVKRVRVPKPRPGAALPVTRRAVAPEPRAAVPDPFRPGPPPPLPSGRPPRTSP
ncbi:MAG: helix-turn-helix domain-containing protein [Chloroflexota bacterium]